jgi:hypothetical protein
MAPDEDETMNTIYLSATETAKLIRAQLKAKFPGVKFGVRTHSYSMGSSIYVKWVDGPAFDAVNAVTSSFQGARFDGSIDLAYSVKHWLLPDGTMEVASSDGTTGSHGSHSPERHWMPHPEAKLVHCGSYVTCTREVSASLRERVAAWVGRRDWRFLDAYTWRPFFDEAEAVSGLSQRAMVVDGVLMIGKGR